MNMEQLPFDAPVLRWGIKRSFINYLSRLPDGSVLADSGASIVSGSYFQFEPAGGASVTDAGMPTDVRIRKFRGQVRLGGHHGMLSLLVADPWLEYRAEGAVLTVSDHQVSPGSGGRLELLGLSVPDWPRPGAHHTAGTEWTELPAKLSRDAVELFNGQYLAGEEMDPLFLGPAVPVE